MGEGQNLAQLREALQIVWHYGVKTCLYSGCESVEPFRDLLPLLDYLKWASIDRTVAVWIRRTPINGSIA